jgi:hypothetical protein
MILLLARRRCATLQAVYDCMAPAGFKASELRAEGWEVVVRDITPQMLPFVDGQRATRNGYRPSVENDNATRA